MTTNFEERLFRYLKAVRIKNQELKKVNGRVPSNKAAKLKGAEKVILAILDNDRLDTLWENMNL